MTITVGFLCIEGLQNFIAPISRRLAADNRFKINEYWIKDFDNLKEKLPENDVLWFEWANEIPILFTQNLSEFLKDKAVIVRLHSYEALSGQYAKINWETVDHIVFVADHVKRYCDIDHPSQLIIANGVNLDQFNFKNKTHGNDIAFIGQLSAKKGIMLLAQAFASLSDHFHLHIAGLWADERERVYFAHIIQVLGISDRIHYYGELPHMQIPEFLSDKNYIICTSPWESQNLSVCEAMAAGCKPLVHHFWGADYVYPLEYIWDNIFSLNRMVSPDSPFDSFEYRKFIKKNYDLDQKTRKISDLIAYARSAK